MRNDGIVVALVLGILKGITHPTMLARYNLRGQEAPDDSGAFFFMSSGKKYRSIQVNFEMHVNKRSINRGKIVQSAS